ncbi:MAG TPA: CRTAC1 family protein, partial [Polyangiaceae bacterium]|nr:CRTAC1 family protein [Polyangiaceae bacterium]
RGQLRFVDVTEAMGIAPDGLSWAAAAFDFDHDGDQDIFVANDGGTIDFGNGPVVVNPQQLPMNVLLENRGNHFVDRAADLGVEGPYSSMGAVVEDFDRDGQFEMFIPDFGANKLFKANARGYGEVAAQFGLTAGRRLNDACDAQTDSQLCLLVSWGAAFEDFNQDGKRELLLLNHEQTSGAAQPVQLFEQQGDGFGERSLGLPNLPAHALISADFDHDGDLDWVASTVGEGLLVFENVATDHCQQNWLTVTLNGQRSNREGIGSAVEITREDGSIQRRILGYGGMPHASLPAEVNFGLGAHSVKRLRVTWPTGETTTVLSPKPQTRITVYQK